MCNFEKSFAKSGKLKLSHICPVLPTFGRKLQMCQHLIPRFASALEGLTMRSKAIFYLQISENTLNNGKEKIKVL